MKKLGLIFISFIALCLFASDAIRDLENQLQTLSGKKKITVLMQLAEHYEQKNIPKAYQFANQILDLTAKNEYHKERAIAYKISGINFFQNSDYPKAIESFEKVITISLDKKFEKETADSYLYLGMIYLRTNQITKAEESFLQALEKYRNLKNSKGESETLHNLGLVFWKWNKYSQALENYQNSLVLKETLQDSIGIAASLNLIGDVYIQLNRFDDALENYNKSLIIYDKLNHKKGLSDTFHNVGNIYRHLGEYDKALDYFIRALKIREQIQEVSGIAYCLYHIGAVYQAQQSFRLANDYFTQAQKKFNELNDYYGIAITISGFAKNEFLEKKYDSAIRKVIESNQIAQNEGSIKVTMENYDLLSRIYAAKGDFKNALIYFQSYDELKDTFFKEELRKVTEIRIDYENQRKDRQIDLLKRERQIIELQMEAQKANLRTLVILFTFSCLMLVFLFHRYLFHKKAKNELIKQTEQLKAVAKTDTLTKISNKNDLIEHLEREQKRFARNQKSFVIMVADLDDFARINEQYGKEAGDFVLRTFSNLIRSSVRRHDIIGRWEGEQFLMILPETDLQGGQIISEKIRKKIATNPVSYKDMNIYITVTIGLTIYNKSAEIDLCIGKAEKALETGKKRGKNCVIISPV